MGETSKALGAEGGGYLVHACQREWRLSPDTEGVRARYETWLEHRARQSVLDRKASMRPDEYAEELALVRDDVMNDRYSWGGVQWARSLNGQANITELVRLLLEEHHPGLKTAEVRDLMTDNPEGFGTLLRQILAGDQDPNGPRPETTTSPETPAA